MAGALGGSFPAAWLGGGLWPARRRRRRRVKAASDKAGAGEVESASPTGRWNFPLRAATTAGALALVGDTGAQVLASRQAASSSQREWSYQHDWVRSTRMYSYGFALYGPLSHVWYEFLDKLLPQKTAQNLCLKVGLNQVVLGPCVIAIAFAWNHLWQNQLAQLPAKYQRHAFPTLMNGWKFWIPASVLNFGVVPLQARVAFMSTCSIFWNLYLSSVVMSK